MDTDRPSTTALVSAFGRAYHVAHERPPIFDDYLASSWFTEEERATFFANLSKAVGFFAPEAASAGLDRDAALKVVLRSQSLGITLPRARLTEDTLAQHHVQYVILGAGLDTFAFRHTERMATLNVFEVDHPATQTWKRARIAQLGWPVPPTLHFVPIDLSQQALGPALDAVGFRRDVATLFSWLGVTYYLDGASVHRTLADLAALAGPGSALVFDYLEPAAFDPATMAPSMAKMHHAVQRAGEPMRTGLPPGELASVLAAAGWTLAENLGPAAIEQRWFAPRGDGYAPLPHFWIATASKS
jgi:methyltransferase (TIGR00027 family)